MKILFYLPVVTPWWFDQIIVPMLRALVREAELHVMVAPLWQNTGIDAEQLGPLSDLEAVQWHIIHGEEHPLFRTDGARVSGMLDRVAMIHPDLTICRSADFATPARFPGQVRFLMEGAAAPFETDPRCVILDKTPFTQGALPPLDQRIRDACLAAIGPIWSARMTRFRAADHPDWRKRLELPEGRPMLAVPLQYEHEENLFLRHAAYPDNLAMLKALLAELDPTIMLAITDHPLNRLHVDRSALVKLIASEPNRMALAVADEFPGGATALLASHANGMVQDLSKVWSMAAFFGTPLVRLGVAPSAPWLGAHHDLKRFQAAMRAGRVRKPDNAHARLWFGWHLGTRVFNPTSADFSLSTLLGQVQGIVDADSIAARIVGHAAIELERA